MEQQAVWAAGQEAQKRAARERALAEEQQMSDIMLAQVGGCDLTTKAQARVMTHDSNVHLAQTVNLCYFESVGVKGFTRELS